MKIVNIIQWLIMVFTIPSLLISAMVISYSQSLSLYENGFSKYNISQVTGISREQLHDAAGALIDYFKNMRDTPQIKVNIKGKELPLYNEKELLHLKDVCSIIDVFRTLLIISIILLLTVGVLLLYRKEYQKLLRGLQIGAFLTFTLILIVVLWSVIDFDSLFYLFHIVSFSNNLWLLDPQKDYLIKMFPEGFFNDAAISMVTTILIEAAVLFAVAFLLQKMSGNTTISKIQKT